MAPTAGTYSDQRWYTGSIIGDSVAAIVANQRLRTYVAPVDGAIGGIQGYAETAGTGGGNTVLDVLINGTSIWGVRSADRPTLAAVSTGAFALKAPTTFAVQRGDRVALVVSSISTTGHALLSLTVALERTHQNTI